MKIAIITGASSGMGREFVRQLCDKESYDEVWVIARRRERLEELEGSVSAKIRAVPLDLTKSEAYDELKALLEAEKPEVKTLVNASGFGVFEKFENIPLSQQLSMIDLNDKALVSVTYIVLPYLKSGSEVYQIGSLSSFQPVPYIGVYGATKAFVLSFTRAINAELRNSGIKMMAVCPGWVKTEFFDTAVVDDSVITYYNQFFTAEQVVKRAVKDMKRGKDVSVVGPMIRLQVLATKLLPHKLVMWIWLGQQKKR